MLDWIIGITGSLVVLGGTGVAIWSFIDTRHKREKQMERSQRRAGEKAGMAICAATIDHILERCPDGTTGIEIVHKISGITSLWAEYDNEAYQAQKEICADSDENMRLLRENRLL